MKHTSIFLARISHRAVVLRAVVLRAVGQLVCALSITLCVARCTPIYNPKINDAFFTQNHEIVGVEREKILDTLATLDNEQSTIRALARAELIQGDERATFRQAVVVQKPSRLRIEMLPLTAAYTLSLLVVNKGALTYLEPPEKRAVTSTSSEELIRSLLKIPLSEREIMSLLFGRVPLSVRNEVEHLYLSPDGASYILVTKGGAARFQISATSKLLQEAEIFKKSGGVFLAGLSWSPELLEHTAVPAKVALKAGVDEYQLALQWTMIKENSEIPPGLFSVIIPSDYTHYER